MRTWRKNYSCTNQPTSKYPIYILTIVVCFYSILFFYFVTMFRCIDLPSIIVLIFLLINFAINHIFPWPKYFMFLSDFNFALLAWCMLKFQKPVTPSRDLKSVKTRHMRSIWFVWLLSINLNFMFALKAYYTMTLSVAISIATVALLSSPAIFYALSIYEKDANNVIE